ncbi:MAG: response regulator [Verrucomicrobiota bacterium]
MSAKPCILVVDDEVKNVKLLEALLTPSGFHIEKAYNGKEALERVARVRPDVILLDVMMPVLDGFEVCRRLKNDPETQLIPIVIMTALSQVEDRIKGKEAGADDFLTKPVDRRELMARIQSLLRFNQAMIKKVAALEQIQRRLSHFVPSSVARSVSQNPNDTDFHQKQRDVSVLFADISGYTRMSEALPQEQVSTMVETLFSCFIDCIHSRGGEISSTAGDGIMVIFESVDPAEHAVKATQSALEFLQVTEQMEREPSSLALFDTRHEPISVHIGIHSGSALVGPTKIEGATATRWVYTAIGSVVNLASRIGSFAQAGTVLISEETARRVAGRFSLKELGAQDFKNVALPSLVFQVLAEDSSQLTSNTPPSI